MSGICSRHQGHDPSCSLCTKIPLTDEEKSYYKGWHAYPEAAHRNGWVFTEAHVMDAFEALEASAKVLLTGGQGGPGELQANFEALGKALSGVEELRRLKRGFRE